MLAFVPLVAKYHRPKSQLWGVKQVDRCVFLALSSRSILSLLTSSKSTVNTSESTFLPPKRSMIVLASSRGDHGDSEKILEKKKKNINKSIKKY